MKRIALLLLLLTGACLPLPPAAVPSPPPPPPSATPAPSSAPLPTETPLPSPTATAPAHPDITRVVIFSVDGLRPEAIEAAPMPVLQALMHSGAYSLKAQTIHPSVTLPSHTSMLTGLCPAAHGVDWNDYEPEQGFARGTDLFDLAHAAGMRTVMVTGKEKLRQITEPSSLDVFQFVSGSDAAVGRRAAELIPEGFGLLFVHFPGADLAGHDYGWMSAEQFAALRGVDEALGTVLAALEAARMRSQTLILVTADHGGHDTTHGYDQPSDMTIPWAAAGPGIQPGELGSPINTTDTAATAAWALALPIPAEWAGRPVLEAFGLPDLELRPEPRCQ